MTLMSQWLTKIKNYPVNPSLPEHLAIAGGRHIHVAPISGSDQGREGKSPDKAVKTLTRALALATAGQNDIVFFHGEGNAAASCTDSQSALLDWNKDMVHLIGVNAGQRFSQRSRVAFASAYDAATDLFKLSASSCYIANMQFIMGVAGTSPTGCMTVTGDRNHLKNCHIAGFAGASHANDIAGAYSLNLNGAEECHFEDCVIGVDSEKLGYGTANSQILFQGVTKLCTFERCRTVMYTNSGTAHLFLISGAGSLARWMEFKDCLFINFVTTSAGTALTYAFDVDVNCSGLILLTGKTQTNAAKWNHTDTANILCVQDSATANVIGILKAVTA